MLYSNHLFTGKQTRSFATADHKKNKPSLLRKAYLATSCNKTVIESRNNNRPFR